MERTNFTLSAAGDRFGSDTRQALLKHLIGTQELPITWGPIFDAAPGRLPPHTRWERVEGMLLGLAIGDALGNTTEGLIPDERRYRHGEVRDYQRLSPAGKPIGRPSDDTQLAFWTLEQLLADGRFEPDQLADRFCRQEIFGIGKSMRAFIKTYKSGRRPWYHCGAPSAGNGTLMRIAPMLVPHLRSGTPELWAEVALSAAVTHRDGASISACVAFASLLWQALQLHRSPSPDWWLDHYVEVARVIEGRGDYRPRGGDFKDFQGPLWRYTEERVRTAYRQGLPVLAACNSWHSGAYLLETVPSAIYILMRHAHDPVEAIVRAVNDTKDNDTVAAIVGAAVGALHGKQALPERWIDGLPGRTGKDDDGRVFQLIDAARTRWWDGR